MNQSKPCKQDYKWRPYSNKLVVSASLCNTLIPEVFRDAVKKTSGNTGTESHFHAVDSCQICHMSNYTINQSQGCYRDSSNQEQGSDSDPI